MSSPVALAFSGAVCRMEGGYGGGSVPVYRGNLLTCTVDHCLLAVSRRVLLRCQQLHSSLLLFYHTRSNSLVPCQILSCPQFPQTNARATSRTEGTPFLACRPESRSDHTTVAMHDACLMQLLHGLHYYMTVHTNSLIKVC